MGNVSPRRGRGVAERWSPMPLSAVLATLGEGNAEHERNFADTFITTRDYEAVARMSRSLVFGARGAGKSAIFRQLSDSAGTEGDSSLLTVPLSADRTSWPAFEGAVRAANNNALVLSRQWELTLLILCFNALVESTRSLKRKRLIRDLDAEVEKVLERTQLNLRSEGMLTEVFEAAATILRKLPFTFRVEAPFVPVSIELKDDAARPDEQGRDQEKLQIILIEGMYGVLGSLLAQGARLQILADQLDDAWAGKPEQVASLNALITAVMRMKGILVQRGMDQAISFSIFLRSDIYEVLKRSGLDDATKYRRHELHLKWDRTALCRMIDKRIEVAGVPGLRTIDNLFTSERVERRSLVDFLFSRVAPRPRDLIQFLGFCLDEAELRGEDTVGADSLQSAEANYSAWRRDVVLEEARYGRSVKSPESLLSAMSSGPRLYTVKDLNRRLDAAKREYGIAETKPVLIDALFEWGILGVERGRGTAVFVWDLNDLQRPRPKQAEEDEDEEMWVVHPSVWTALDLRAPKRSRPTPNPGRGTTSTPQRK